MKVAAKAKTPALVSDADFAKVAEAIGRISDAAKAMRASGLSRTAIVVLIHDATELSKRDIGVVLDATESLRNWCLTK